MEVACVRVLGGFAGPRLHPAKELVAKLLARQPARVARVRDQKMECRAVLRRSGGRRLDGSLGAPEPDDLDLAGARAVETEIALVFVERAEPSALAEEPHRGRSVTPTAVVALG